MSLSRRAVLAAALFELFPRSTLARRIGGRRWDLSRPIVIENKLGPEWNTAVGAQAAAWRRAYGRFRFRVVHKPGNCRWRKGAIVLCWRELPEGVAAWAAPRIWGREITHVRIEMDPDYVTYGHETGLLLCHEFAHALGLPHNTAGNRSCVGGAQVTRQTPGPYDRRSLRLLYRKRGKKWPANH